MTDDVGPLQFWVRLFVAIWPSAEVLSSLDPMLERLRGQVTRQGVRFTAREKIHLTLQFIGSVEEGSVPALVQSLATNLEGMRSEKLTVTGLGGFPNAERPGILWAGIEGELALLQSRVVEACEDFVDRPDDKPFQPHLTLARVSPPSKKVGVALHPLVGEFKDREIGIWTPNEVRLVQTLPGGAYESVASFPLV